MLILGPFLSRNELRRKTPNTNTVGEDRLKKAIERNRIKQAKRNSQNSKLGTRTLSGTNSSHETSSTFRNKIREAPLSSQGRNLPKPLKTNTPRGTRLSVGNSNNTKMTLPRSLASTRAPSMINYRGQRESTKNKIYKYAYYALWLFCLFLLLRLFFAERGVVEYYSQQSRLMEKIHLQKSILEENKALSEEMKRIKYNNAYQKRIVRNRLGLIAKNEFLILFSEDSQDFPN